MRTAGAALLGLLFVQGVVWYASLHRHVPGGWARVYLASDCPASEFAMWVAERSSAPLATIPVDDGSLSTRACRHTLGLMAEHSAWWKGAEVLPDDLVCARLIRDGSAWMSMHRYDEWPVFVGRDGRRHVGADAEGLRVAGVADEEHQQMELIKELATDCLHVYGALMDYTCGIANFGD